VGQTAASSGTVGTSLRADGRNFFCADGNYAAHFNRNTSDGGIVHFAKDDSIVGSIGNISTRMYIGSGDTGIYFDSVRNQIQPNNPSTGSNIDATIDLGRDVFRFKDLYLSGGVNFSANANASGMTSETLDDYEEGTWTISEVNGQGGTMTTNRAHYTKIGRMVFASASVTVGTTTNTNVLNLSLPFASSINGYYLGGGNVSYHNLPTARSDNIRANVENAAADVHFLYGDNSNPNLKLKCSEASTKRIDFFVQYQV
jgi:hypothetical protein